MLGFVPGCSPAPIETSLTSGVAFQPSKLPTEISATTAISGNPISPATTLRAGMNQLSDVFGRGLASVLRRGLASRRVCDSADCSFDTFIPPVNARYACADCVHIEQLSS